MGSGLRHGPIGPGAVHVCLDMQRLFAPGGPWPTPWAARILPAVASLAEHTAAQTLFTRFIPPPVPENVPGAWQLYYKKWRSVTQEILDPALLDIVPELAWLVPPAHIVDKTRYSAFTSQTFLSVLANRKADCIVFSGAETDVCVLASLFAAVDFGFRVILAEDAVCSSSDAAHDAVLVMLHTRMSVQVEVAPVDDILAHWHMP